MLVSAFEATCSGGSACADIVETALTRMRSRMFYRDVTTKFPGMPHLTALRVVVQGTADLQHGVNESYVLSVPAPADNASIEATITAPNEWGALRGLESFASSVSLIPEGTHGWFFGADFVYALTLWPPARIADEPRTAWRGLMIDTSRHFYRCPPSTKLSTPCRPRR
jgi:hexosaminidase